MTSFPPEKRKVKMFWTPEEDELLLKKISDYRVENDLGVYDDILWPAIALAFESKKPEDCASRFFSIHMAGNYFATISEVWNPNSVRNSIIALDDWDSCKGRVCRDGAPEFDRRLLGDENREPKEFVNAMNGALLNESFVAESITTVNDNLIPVDIFGETRRSTEKVHLLPKARNDAITWLYPGCAVLGLDIERSLRERVAEKAVLGCTDSTKKPAKKYPGIRNLLCNIVRMSGSHLFDQHPDVLIFPMYDINEAKNWAGQGYEAIVVCASAESAKRIGMTSVALENTDSASVADINKAVNLASEVCQFLAYSVLEKTEETVKNYQNAGEIQAHKTFRKEKKIKVPFDLSSLPTKPVFKISFVGHDDSNEGGHPAPDPMLLAFKSCNNWCQRFSGFKMVAAAEPEDSDDELSEEGKQNLRAYMEWQAEREKSLRHSDIMDRFGHEGGGVWTS